MAGLWLSTLGVRRASAAAGLLVLGLSGCSGEVVNLGSSGTMLAGGDAGGGSGAPSQAGGGGATALPQTRLVLTQPSADMPVLFANGTLTGTADLLYFTFQERGEPESFIESAELVGTAWSTRSRVVFEGVGVDDASNPAISRNGDRLWLGSRRLGSANNTDVYLSTRTTDGWSRPTKVEELSSPADDAPRPPAMMETIMPLSSNRHGGDFHQIYFAERADDGQPWGEPSQALLGTVNSPDYESGDGFLTENGLTLYFSSTRAGSADLYRARRSSLMDPFGEPEPLIGVNTAADERDPWLPDHEQQLFFTSNRSGIYEIYTADYRR